MCTLFYEKGVKHLIIETLPDTASDRDFKEFVDQFNEYLDITAISSGSIHDREMTFYRKFDSNYDTKISGYRVNLGRGLDIYKPPQDRYKLGSNGDFHYRKCKETTITVTKKDFGLEEFHKEQEVIKKIKDILEVCVRISEDRTKNTHYKTEFYNNQICKIDSLDVPSTFKYAKAHRKKAVNQINSL